MSAGDIIKARDETIAYLERVYLPSRHRQRILRKTREKFNIWIFSLDGKATFEEHAG